MRRKKAPLNAREIELILYPVTEMFMTGKTAGEIAQTVFDDFGVSITRESVYPLIRQAVERGHILLVPPRDKVIASRLGRHFEQRLIDVVHAPGEQTTDHVATAAAQRALELMMQIAAGRASREVHLGLGIGHTTWIFVKRLASLLRAQDERPKVVVHAIAPGFSFWDPSETPQAMLTYLKDALDTVGFEGFFGDPVVEARQYETALRSPVLRSAFEHRGEIDILVTSLAGAADQHGFLRQYLTKFDESKTSLPQLEEAGWIGDLHLRPYSDEGPIEIRSGMKPITLFEIPELVEMANHPDKHVILMAGPCNHCRVAKARALYPFVTSRVLRVCNNLIIDRRTAEDLIGLLEPKGPKPSRLARSRDETAVKGEPS